MRMPCRTSAASNPMQIDAAQQVGDYLVTPLTKLTECGNYVASVSIRRGMHDRVFRLLPHFECATRAARYAFTQGQLWVQNKHMG